MRNTATRTRDTPGFRGVSASLLAGRLIARIQRTQERTRIEGEDQRLLVPQGIHDVVESADGEVQLEAFLLDALRDGNAVFHEVEDCRRARRCCAEKAFDHGSVPLRGEWSAIKMDTVIIKGDLRHRHWFP